MYERRLKIFLAMVGVGVAVMLVRLGYLQLLLGEEFRQRARDLLVRGRTLPTCRGQIRDRRGRVLATDAACFDLCFDYGMLARDRRWVRRRLRRIAADEGLPRDDPRVQEIFEHHDQRTWRLAQDLTGTGRNEMMAAAENAVARVQAIRAAIRCRPLEEELPHPIVRGLTQAKAMEILSHADEMIGVTVQPSHRRRYPYADVACHVIGRVGRVTRADLRRNGWRTELPVEVQLACYLPGDVVGRVGVEKACDEPLRGARGFRRIHRSGQAVGQIAPVFGSDVQLTLDIELQKVLADRLRARRHRGAIVVIDVPTGEVLALVSVPTYDLNTYRMDFPRLNADTLNLPLWNRAVAVRYPPGSTFKPLIALGALAGGVITPATAFNCRGYLHDPGAFRCWTWKHRRGHGTLRLVEALEQSCNVFFYNVGERFALRRMNDWLGQMGFRQVPGTHLPDERPSHLPDPQRVTGAGEARFLAIGQGQITTTPLHVANAIAAIARDGQFRSPLLMKVVDRATGRAAPAVPQEVRRLPVTAAHLRLVQEGMYRVVHGSRGTARKFRHASVTMGAKTGTATTAARRADTDGDGTPDVVLEGDTAWFVGFAPYRKPQIAFAVVVEYSDQSGGATCGPIALEVLDACMKFGYLTP